MSPREDAGSPEDMSRTEGPWRRRAGPAFAVLLAGLAVSLTMALVMRSADIGGAERDFIGWTQDRARLVQNEIDAQLRTASTAPSLDEMLQRALPDTDQTGIAAQVLDAASSTVLAAIAPDSQDTPSISRAVEQRALHTDHPLQLADESLVLRFLTTPAYVGQPRPRPVYVLFGAGLIASILGAVAAYQLTRRSARLQVVTEELRAEIVERRHSEQRVAESEARYRVLVENSPDAIVLHENERITFANSASARLHGVGSVEDLVGRSIFELTLPEHHDEMRARLSQLKNLRRQLPPIEQKMRRPDGTMLDVELLTVPFETEHGLVVHVTVRDITQRKAAEAERERLQNALRQSQKLEAVGTLAGGVAHDFNNVLTAIVGNAHLLLEDLPQSHPALRSVLEIRTAANRARELVKRLTTFSRQQESQRVPTAVAPLIGELQQLMRATMPAGIELSVSIDPRTPAILADATQIQQVLLNLCTNARQAMGDSGLIQIDVGPLDKAAAQNESGVELIDAERFVRMCVRDTGPGVPPAALPHIFEPFFTTKDPGEGTGLGLAVVHGIVQSHQGAITVQNREGEGAVFCVYLPASDAEATAEPPLERSTRRGAQQHVCYIDDEEALLSLAALILQRGGFRCSVFQNAAEAVQALRRSPDAFDLVITDLNMPGMNGMEAAREMLAIRSDIPIIITTGHVRAADVAAARQLGVRDVVLKPDTIDELAQLVLREIESGQEARMHVAEGSVH